MEVLVAHLISPVLSNTQMHYELYLFLSEAFVPSQACKVWDTKYTVIVLCCWTLHRLDALPWPFRKVLHDISQFLTSMFSWICDLGLPTLSMYKEFSAVSVLHSWSQGIKLWSCCFDLKAVEHRLLIYNCILIFFFISNIYPYYVRVRDAWDNQDLETIMYFCV